MKSKPPYKRVLLKLSGEILMGNQSFGINQEGCIQVANFLSLFHNAGIELGVVIGGGNIFRGLDLKSTGMARTPADHMGMLATLFNGIALQQALMSLGMPVCVMSALECPKVAEPYQLDKGFRIFKRRESCYFCRRNRKSLFYD